MQKSAAVILIAFSAFVLHFIMTRKANTADWNVLIRRIRPFLLQSFVGVLRGQVRIEELHDRMGGARGLWDCRYNSAVLVKLCQVCDDALPREVDEVAALAKGLRSKALWALAWNLIRAFCPAKANLRMLEVAAIYREITIKTRSLYADSSAHLCAKQLAAVL